MPEAVLSYASHRNLFCQQLVSDKGLTPYYWSAPHSSGEIDFIVQLDGDVVPIEVKAEES